MVAGLLQKVAMTSMPAVMAEQGSKYADRYVGGFTPEQRKRMDTALEQLRQHENEETGENATRNGPSSGGIIAVKTRDVGENNNNPMVSFYAAAIGVMFLLFTASGAAGSLLDEADSGTLERVLSSRVTMTTLLAGKLAFNTLLAFSQLVLMFLWAWAVFKLDFFDHIPGFVVMDICTAFAWAPLACGTISAAGTSPALTVASAVAAVYSGGCTPLLLDAGLVRMTREPSRSRPSTNFSDVSLRSSSTR
jgi:ABC-2 type transport system permease protein